MTDSELLKRFIEQNANDAFAELVRRHIGWVGSMARRLVGDPASADDVTQTVFILLARKARKLEHDKFLAGWLFKVTRFAARAANRSEQRRRRHERGAAQMRTEELEPESTPNWTEIVPLLDESVGALRQSDREAILLRFYEQKSFPQIGGDLRISEEAARKRVNRAVDALRSKSARRGVRTSPAALAIVLGTQLSSPASAASTTGVTSVALSAANGGQMLGATGSLIKGVQAMLFWTTLKPAAIAILAILLGSAALSIALQLQPQPAEPPPTANLLRGRIFTPDNKPLTGAKVWLGSGIPSQPLNYVAGRTNDQGGFDLAATSGTLSLIAQSPGYALTSIRYVPRYRLEQDLKIQPATTLRLRVLDPAGNPAPRVAIALDGWAGGLVFASGVPQELKSHFVQTTDATGVCVFSNLPQDSEQRFEVLDDRFAMPAYGQVVRLSKSATTEGTLALIPAASISGQVVNADGTIAPAGVRVRATNKPLDSNERGPALYGMTDLQGRFRIGQLRPGPYYLTADLPEPMRLRYAVRGLQTQLALAEKLDNQNLSLVVGGLVQGKVTMPVTGEPVGDVTVSVQDLSIPDGRPGPTTLTAADGSYQLRVASGRVRVSANPPRFSPNNPQAATKEDSVVDDESRTIDVALRSSPSQPAGIRVSGRVISPTGQVVPGATVLAASTARQAPPQPLQTRSDEAGRFEFASLDLETVLFAYNARWTTIAPVSIKDKDEIELTVYDDAFSSVRVVVVDDQGKPLSGASLTFDILAGRTLDSPVDRRRTTGEDGSWTFESLSPDRQIDIIVRAKGFAPATTRPAIERGKQTVAMVKLAKSDAAVNGIVVDEVGNPLASATVMIFQTQSRLRDQQTTDEQGKFNFPDFAAGTRVQVTVMAGRETSQPAFINAGAPATVVFRPPPRPNR